MGQRHQIYVVARLRPAGDGQPRYRCIVALHDQWCYGRLPLKGTRRFFSLIKQSENIEIVRAELKALDGKYDRDESLSPIPCPYIAFLLTLSWTADLSNPVLPMVSSVFPCITEDCNMQPSTGDNNDGITVLDITDPSSPAYCFASIVGLEATVAGQTTRWVNYNAEHYVRAYYHVPDETQMEDERVRLTEEDVANTIASLDGEKIVGIATLMSVWPTEYAGRMKKPPRGVPKLGPLYPRVKDTTSSVELDHLLDMLETPGNVECVKDILREHGNLTERHLQVLQKLTEEDLKSTEKAVDLSGLNLSYAQLLQLTPALADDVQTLNMSYNSALTIQAVHHILSTTSHLKRLFLVSCPLISGRDISDLLKDQPALFYKLESIIHPHFFRPFNNRSDDPQYPIQFTFIGSGSPWNSSEPIPVCALPFFSPTAVIQSFTDYLKPFCHPPSLTTYSFGSATLLPACVFTAAPRKPNQGWCERAIYLVPQFSLRGLLGQGWVLALDSLKDPRIHTLRYGFVRLNAQPLPLSDESFDDERDEDGPLESLPDAQYDHIHDLRSFLLQMEEDGRPKVPEETVKELEDVFRMLDPTLNPEHTASLELFTREQLDEFIKAKQQAYANMRRFARWER